MYTQRIIGEGKRESEYWFKIKQIWLKVKYKDNFDHISKKDFFQNFLEHAKTCGITWEYTDKKGNPKIPGLKDYDHARKHSCFKKYQWDECFEQYEHDQMTRAEQNARKAYRKSIPERTVKKLQQANELDNHKDKLIAEQKNFDVSNEDKILKTERTSSEILSNIRDELELNKQRFEFDGNVNSEVNVNLLEKVKAKRRELNELGD